MKEVRMTEEEILALWHGAIDNAKRGNPMDLMVIVTWFETWANIKGLDLKQQGPVYDDPVTQAAWKDYEERMMQHLNAHFSRKRSP